MRILHADSGREMRGGQWQVLYLLRGLRDRGHDVRLLARRDGPLYRAASADGFTVRAMTAWELLRSTREMELTHAHDAHVHAVAAACGSGPLVVARRVAFPVKRSALSRWKYARADHFLAVSHSVEQMLLDAGLKPERITVVYDGVPVMRPAAPSRGHWIIAPATSDPMKGSALAREAAALAGADLRFSVDLPADLPAAAALLYVTRSEGLGSAALLAMAASTPVIASRTGGLPEAVEDGITGLLVENRADSIAAAIRRLLDDAEFAARLGEAGRRRALERFSVDAMVDGTLACYRKVLG